MAMIKNILLTPLFDEPGAGSGGGAAGAGAPAGGSGSAGATGTPGASGTPAGSATPGAGAAPTATPTGFTYPEDRSKWIPDHRFKEVSTEVRTLKEAIAERDRKIAAVMGVTTPNADDARAAQIKDAFFNLPGMGVMKKLSGLSDEQIDRMLSAADGVDSVKQNEMRGWQKHGNESVDHIASGVAEALGADSLDASQKEDLRNTFSSWLKRTVETEMRASDGQESKTLERYENGEKKLLDEFVAAYTKRWVEPARRTAAAKTSTRIRPTPNSMGRNQVTSLNRPEKFKSLDERLDYAVNRAKELGVQFDR